MASWKVIERYIMTPTDPVEGLNALPNNTHRNWIRDRGLQKLNLVRRQLEWGTLQA